MFFNFQSQNIARIVALYKSRGHIVYSPKSVYTESGLSLQLTKPSGTGHP